MNKTCTKCNIEKQIGEFSLHSTNKDRLQGSCKSCASLARASKYASNPDAARSLSSAWNRANPVKVKARKAAYRVANREQIAAYDAARRKDHPEKIKAQTNAWRKANPEKVKATKAAWDKANRQKQEAYAATYRANNKDKIKASEVARNLINPKANSIKIHNRRAMARVVGGKLSKGLSDSLFKLQQGKCPCCGKALGTSYQLDHVQPIARGGSNTDENMQLLRSVCNRNKSSKHPIEFMQQRGFLL